MASAERQKQGEWLLEEENPWGGKGAEGAWNSYLVLRMFKEFASLVCCGGLSEKRSKWFAPLELRAWSKGETASRKSVFMFHML